MPNVQTAIAALYKKTPQGACFVLGADFPAFNGHFPSDPILPAIVQIQMAVYVISQQEGFVKKLKQIKKAKFLDPIRAGDCIELFISPAGLGYAVLVKKTDVLCASFTLEVE